MQKAGQQLHSWLLRYGFALAMVAASILLRYALVPLLGQGYQYVTVFPFIIIVAMFAGRWPAILHSVLAGLIATYLFATAESIHPYWAMALVIFTGVLAGSLAQSLKFSEAIFRTAYENAAVGIELMDLDGKFIKGNTVLSEILGYTPQELKNLNFSDITFKEDLQKEQPMLADLLAGQISSYTIEKRYIHKNGKIIWVRVSSSLAKLHKKYRIAVIENINERKKVEDDLRESEERLRLAQEAAKIGTFEWNIKTGVNTWTPEVEKIYGLRPGEFAKTQAAFEELVYPEDRDYVADLGKKALETGEPVEGEWRVAWPDGSIHWIASRAQVFKDESGKPIRMTGVNYDITERKLAEEKLLEFKDKLEEKNKELESIIGVVSHDLRSPLVNVRGFANEIKKECSLITSTLKEEISREEALSRLAPVFEESVPESVNFIESSATAMNNLVNALVEVARAGLAVIKPEVLDMNEIMREVLASIEFKFRQAQVSYQIDMHLPSIVADRTQVTQIFSNLLDNAVKYLDPNRKGKVSVGGRIQGANALFWVADNGIGISAEDQGKLFNIYTQLHEKAAGGVGMGLATVKRMVDRNNGKIWVISEKDKGSTFYVMLPAPDPGRG